MPLRKNWNCPPEKAPRIDRSMIKILSWNVNGLRACARKTFQSWMDKEKADILCLQEIKANPDQLDDSLRNIPGYQAVWNPAKKKGYSGVAIYSRQKPISIQRGLGQSIFDVEGRTLILEYPDFFLINAYFPNGQRDHKRVPFKMKYCKIFTQICQDLLTSGKELVITGDFNTAHQEIDLRNPKSNQNTTGFLPRERKWVGDFIEMGFVDIFRIQHPEPHQYTWWSYRKGVREKNIGWRIDYFFVSRPLTTKVQNTYHQSHVMGSDHCPIGLEINL